MSEKDVRVCYGVDFDAVSGWMGRPNRSNSYCDVSRGVNAAEVAVPVILDLFRRHGIRATFFIPGHTIETFRAQCESIVAEGHEVALHGYSHENILSLTPAQEEKVLARQVAVCQGLTGQKPLGYRSPGWEFTAATARLLLQYGILYDSSLMHRDFEAYYVASGDRWYPIDYTQDPDTWMKPMEFGQETELVEIPASWSLDDFPPTVYIKGYPGSPWTDPSVLFASWKADFDFLYERGEGVFPLTLHPDATRPRMISLLHERLLRYLKGLPGVSFCTYGDYAREWKTKHPFVR